MDRNQLQAEIGRVLEDGALSSPQLRRILEYLGQAAADDRADMKEYTIGVEALGKPSSYDPQQDSTVRVQVGKLREKLDAYYREGGAGHPIRLTLPKGSFRLQLESQAGVPDGAVEQPGTRALAGTLVRTPIRTPRRTALLVLMVGLVAGAVVFVSGYTLGSHSAAQAAAAGRGWTPEMHQFWQPIVGNGRPIVVSYDVAMTIDLPPWRLRHPEINGPEDLATSQDWQELSKKLGHPAVRTDYLYVGFGIANGALMLGQLLSGYQLRPNVKRSTVLSWEDLTDSHLVFIGSGKTTKIIQSILQRGDFAWDSSKVAANRINNLRPHPGEPASFAQVMDPNTYEYGEQYALISMMPGFDEDTRVLILGGGTSEGDWAITEYVTLPANVDDLVRHLRDKNGKLPKSFQVVVRIKYESRVPISIEYVTHHALTLPPVLQREFGTR